MHKLMILVSVVFSVFYCGNATNPEHLLVSTKGEIWPAPFARTKYHGYFTISYNNFAFQISDNSHNCTLLQKSLNRYQLILRNDQDKRYLSSDYQGNLEVVKITLQEPCSDEEYPSLEASEQYSLTITSNNTELIADTVWGIIWGLETFSQIIYLETSNDVASLRIDQTQIIDQPRFHHRGLLLDTSRHYILVKTIQEILEGMVLNKMNVFHWHIVDDQSFPYESTKYPELSEKGAYTKRLVYKQDEVKELIEYARERGIRIIPEFDTPGHTRSWGLSHPELLCTYENITGPLDPSKNATYEFLSNVFNEVRKLFKDKYIYLGGDEVDYTCWDLNTDIVQFMEELGLYGSAEYINYYGQKVINMVDYINFSSIVWEEMLFDGVQLPNNTVVQIWRDWYGQLWTNNIKTVTGSGKKAVLSSCWYLDQTKRTWANFYDCDPHDFGGTDSQNELVIGGEACMWGELINEYNVVPRIFPRASATAEILWSPRDSGTFLEARLEEHSCRMNRRGVAAEPPNGPSYCD